MADEHTPDQRRKFVRFMNHLHSPPEPYPADHTFTNEQLLAITPEHVQAYLQFLAWGDGHPAPDAQPNMRSDTLGAHKSAISHFMPRRAQQWDPITRAGNPTMSPVVRGYIQQVQRREARGNGAPSQARRNIEFAECMSLLAGVHLLYVTNADTLFFVAALLAVQWHIIGRLDDMMRLRFHDITHSTTWPFALIFRMCASKNIRTERQIAEQIMLGSMNPLLCPLLNIAKYVEVALTRDRDHGRRFIFGDGGSSGREMSCVRRVMKAVIESDFFERVREGLLGTHSLRKGPATYASRCGLPRDYIKRRGRWAGRREVVDSYINANLPYPDARTAQCLCGPEGAAMYGPRDGVQIPHSFLERVAPNCHHFFEDREVARALAYPLLWAAFENTYMTPHGEVRLLPDALAASLRQMWHDAGGDATNPIEKRRLIVSGTGDQLFITPARNPRGNPQAAVAETNGDAVPPADEAVQPQAQQLFEPAGQEPPMALHNQLHHQLSLGSNSQEGMEE